MKKQLALPFALLFLLQMQLSFGQTAGDYRSFGSGSWSLASTWQTYNGSVWVAATVAPSSTDGIISIQASHTVTVNTTVLTDQTVINTGGTLIVSNGTLQVDDGTGVDLVVNGAMSFSGSFMEGAGTNRRGQWWFI